MVKSHLKQMKALVKQLMDLAQFVYCRVVQRCEDFQGLSTECVESCSTVRPSTTQRFRAVLLYLESHLFGSNVSPDSGSNSLRLRARPGLY